MNKPTLNRRTLLANWSAGLRVVDQALAPGGKAGTVARYVVQPDRPGVFKA